MPALHRLEVIFEGQVGTMHGPLEKEYFGTVGRDSEAEDDLNEKKSFEAEISGCPQ